MQRNIYSSQIGNQWQTKKSHSIQVYFDEPLIFFELSIKDLMSQRLQCYWKAYLSMKAEPQSTFPTYKQFHQRVSCLSATARYLRNLRDWPFKTCNFRCFLSLVHITFLSPMNPTTSLEKECFCLKEAIIQHMLSNFPSSKESSYPMHSYLN